LQKEQYITPFGILKTHEPFSRAIYICCSLSQLKYSNNIWLSFLRKASSICEVIQIYGSEGGQDPLVHKVYPFSTPVFQTGRL